MRQALLFFICILSLSIHSSAQTTDTFDISTFQPPKDWQRHPSEATIRFSTEDKATGTYALITVFKSLPGTADAKENFDVAWQTLVKGSVNVATAPQVFPSDNKQEWKAQGGFAPFEKDGEKGVVVLVTISGYGKMVNVMVLTNTQTYEPTITAFLESISLKKPIAETVPLKTISASPITGPTASANGYGFATTNFDDGWTSTIQEDWVQVTRGPTRVLIHYPNKQADAYNSVLMDGLKKAWDFLVAPRYTSGSNFEFKPITGWQSIEFAEADLTERATGKTVHVVLFKMNYSNGGGRYLEFITPSKGAFEQEFGAYHQKTYGWENLEKMANYNKFGIAAADLKGKWTNDFSGSLSYVNAYTGAAAGTDTHASIENFSFGPAGTYNWDLGVASGMVGNIKFQSVKSSGKVSVPGVWQITFSSIEGKPRTYAAHFSSIKGARVLWLDGKPFGKLQ